MPSPQLSAEQPQQQPRHAGPPPRCPGTPLEECPRTVRCTVVCAANGTRKYRFQYSRHVPTRPFPRSGSQPSLRIMRDISGVLGDPLTPICGSPGRAMLRVNASSASCGTPPSECSPTPGPPTSAELSEHGARDFVRAGGRVILSAPALFEPGIVTGDDDDEAEAFPAQRGETHDPLQWSFFSTDPGAPEASPLNIYPVVPLGAPSGQSPRPGLLAGHQELWPDGRTAGRAWPVTQQ
eukprot:TRINITY_DN697_c0_g1_i1.p1 TRINITY_DN697_c0_g1~~TRINITY_DN697_c0_g1_i1.p1  ORF type:complete len:237 (+),score=30.99 TRINITY_DN697_c0_g1_i1:89-799(+)